MSSYGHSDRCFLCEKKHTAMFKHFVSAMNASEIDSKKEMELLTVDLIV